MPFKSKSQMRKFGAMEDRGEIPAGTTRRWGEHTPDMKGMPEHKSKGKPMAKRRPDMNDHDGMKPGIMKRRGMMNMGCK